MSSTAELTMADPAAVVAQYERLVWRVVRRYAGHLPPWAPADDLAQECRFAVYRAANGFDPGRGVKFITYATTAAARAAGGHLRTEWKRGFRGLGDGPVPTPRVVTEAVGPDGDVVPAADLVAARPSGGAVRWPADRWARVLECLTPRERAVVRLRLHAGLTNAQVGARLGFSRGRADQVWQMALRKIRAAHPELADELGD